MAPNSEKEIVTKASNPANGNVSANGYLEKDESYDADKDEGTTVKEYKMEIVWSNVIYMGLFHLLGLNGIYLMLTEAKWQTTVFALGLSQLSGYGITAGAHRLWTHRSYKAKLPLRILLAILNTLASQNDIYEWCRDHRVHHKYAETDADPHNSKRGFFFSHVGWLLCRKHPEVIRKGQTIDMSDLKADPVVMFQKTVYGPATFLCAFIIPTVVPSYYWGENFWTAFMIATCTRYCLSLNASWTVNSLAHMFGNRPYDTSLAASENILVEVLASGEGFHNYHHAFPWDYSTSEFGWKRNTTTMFLDFFAFIGWAYDFKKASPQMIKMRRERTGIPEETHEHSQ